MVIAIADNASDPSSEIISWSNDTTVLGAAYLVVGLLVMVANAIVIFVIIQSHELRQTTMWIITWMAFCDFLFGCLVMTFYMPAAFMRRFPYPDSLQLVSFCLHAFFLGQTLFNICLAMLDRYIAIGWPLRYLKTVTRKRFLVVIFILVSFGFARIGMIFGTNPTIYVDTYLAMSIPVYMSSSTVISLRTIAVLVIPLATVAIIFLSFFRICVICRRSLRNFKHAGSQSIVVIKLPLMTLLSTGVFLMSYVPPFVCIIALIKGFEGTFIIGFLQFAVVLLFSNSFWNVFIYTATYRPFRNALTRTLCYSHDRTVRQRHILRMLYPTRGSQKL